MQTATKRERGRASDLNPSWHEVDAEGKTPLDHAMDKKQLHVVDFCMKLNHGLREAGRLALEKLDKNLTSKKELDFQNCDIALGAAEGLGRLLTRHPTLKAADLTGNGRLFSAEGLVGLATGLGEAGHPALKRLNFGDCDIALEAGEALGRFMVRLPALEEVGRSVQHSDCWCLASARQKTVRS